MANDRASPVIYGAMKCEPLVSLRTKMIMLFYLLLITLSNGEHFLIETSANKTSQDYLALKDDIPGCHPSRINLGMEISCKRDRFGFTCLKRNYPTKTMEACEQKVKLKMTN